MGLRNNEDEAGGLSDRKTSGRDGCLADIHRWSFPDVCFSYDPSILCLRSTVIHKVGDVLLMPGACRLDRASGQLTRLRDSLSI
jgi:hypothetical protein